jgi:hypothetical protein
MRHRSFLLVRASLLISAAAALAATLPPPAAVAQISHVSGSAYVFDRLNGRDSWFTIDEYDRSSPTSVSGSISSDESNDYGGGHIYRREANAYSAASLRYAKARSNTSFVYFVHSGAEGDNSFVNAFAQAEFTLNDVIFTNAAGPLITTSLNLHLGGYLSAGTAPAPFGPDISIDAIAQIGVRITLIQGADFTVIGNGYAQVESSNGNTVLSSGGMLAGFNGGDAVVTTGLFTVAANQPFSLRVALESGTQGGMAANTGGNTGAISDFSNTLTFATDRPVFNLSDGTTANSVLGGIANNQFTALAAADSPEPATAALFATGLLPVLGAACRRRRKRA